MGLRISTQLNLCAGLNNSLSEKLFGGTGTLAEILDTLDHGTSSSYSLAGNETAQLDLGDVGDLRYVYLEGDGEFSVVFGAGTATAGEVTGVGGTYPTAFLGGEHLDLEIDGNPVTVPFTVDDQTRDQVVAKINYAAALANSIYVTAPIAAPSAAQLRIHSTTTGAASTVRVLASSSADALLALGLTAGLHSGDGAIPGTSAVNVSRPADPNGAQVAFGVKSYILGTIRAPGVQVTNLQADVALNLKVLLAGDLTAPL